MLPREHGAWAMLVMPFLVGSVAAGWGGLASLLLLASVLLLFTSSRPLEVLIETRHVASLPLVEAHTARAGLSAEVQERRWLAISRLATYAGLGGSAGLLLLLVYQRWALVAIGGMAAAGLILQLLLRRRRLDRTWPARLLSVAALSAAGPAAYYTASGVLDRHAAAVGLLAFLYSGASVFYVRLFYPHPERRRVPAVDSRARAKSHLLTYLAVGASAIAAISALGWMPPTGGFAFIPLLVKVAWASWRVDRRPTLKQIGFAEIGHTTLFAFLAAAALVTWN